MSKNPKEMSSEDLADIIRTIKVTGITPSKYEQECLTEAADRLDQMDELLDKYLKTGLLDLTLIKPYVTILLKEYLKH